LVTGPQLQIKLRILVENSTERFPILTPGILLLFKCSAQFCFVKLCLHRCHTGTARFSGSTTQIYTFMWCPSSPTASACEFSYTRSIYK